eukprot:6192858-Pleurochrysis_carterae.AAC.3
MAGTKFAPLELRFSLRPLPSQLLLRVQLMRVTWVRRSRRGRRARAWVKSSDSKSVCESALRAFMIRTMAAAHRRARARLQGRIARAASPTNTRVLLPQKKAGNMQAGVIAITKSQILSQVRERLHPREQRRVRKSDLLIKCTSASAWLKTLARKLLSRRLR